MTAMLSRQAFKFGGARSFVSIYVTGSLPQHPQSSRFLSSTPELDPSAPKQWLLRPATLDDSDDVRTLLQRTYQSVMPKYYRPEILSKCLPILCEPQEELLRCGTWYVAHDPTDPERLVGCGGFFREKLLKPSPDPSATTHPAAATPQDTLSQAVLHEVTADPSHHYYSGVTAYLRQFAIDPSYTGLGVASTIWKRTLKDLETITSKTNPKLEVFSSYNAERFYKGRGFTTIKETTLQFSEDVQFPVLLMQRQME